MLRSAIKPLARIAAAIGTPDFYDAAVKALSTIIGSQRCLVVKYSRFSAPEILVNHSMDRLTASNYLKGLYQLDPLLALVNAGDPPRVVSFRTLQKGDRGNSFYDEIYQSGRIYDEIAVLLPTLGTSYIALCIDHSSRTFRDEEIDRISVISPIITECHLAHVRSATLVGVQSLFADGRVGVRVIDEDGNVVYTNPGWIRLTEGNSAPDLIAAALSSPEKMAVTVGDRIVHWENAEISDAHRSLRVIFLETQGAGYLNAGLENILEDFFAVYGLSPRESQIIARSMRGYSSQRIATDLNLTPGTIKNYKRRLYDKMDITTEREVFSRLIEHLAAK